MTSDSVAKNCIETGNISALIFEVPLGELRSAEGAVDLQ